MLLAAPEPPADLSAVAVSANQIELAWQDNSHDESGFRIDYRSSESSDWETLADVDADTQSFSHTGLTSGTHMEYRIRALGARWSIASEHIADTGVNPSQLAVADLNNDGVLDLVVLDHYWYHHDYGFGGTRLGNGDGTFAAQWTFGLPGKPRALATGDVDHDGNVDLVIAMGRGEESIVLLLGNGDGTFAALSRIATGYSAAALAITDLNADGVDDVVAIDDSTSEVVVFLAAGDGSFAAETRFMSGDDASWLTTGDINADGSADIVVVDGRNSVLVWLGDSTGNFDSAETLASGGPARVTDVNGDQIADLVLAYGSVLLGVGDGTFSITSNHAFMGDVTVVDLDGDGEQDLLGTDSREDVLVVQFGRGDASFQPPITIQGQDYPTRVEAHDFDGDGTFDAAVLSIGSDDVRILFGERQQSSAWTGIARATTWGHDGTLREVYTATPTFDGGGFDATVYLNDGAPIGDRMHAWAWAGTGSPAYLGEVPITLSGRGPKVAVDIHDGGLAYATSIRLSAEYRFNVTSVEVHHHEFADLDSYTSMAPQILDRIKVFTSERIEEYYDIAHLYAWDWDAGRFSNDKIALDGEAPQLAPLLLNKQNIILTHGWNAAIDPGSLYDFTSVFARSYAAAHPGMRDQVNILAIDWSGVDARNPRLGSNPNQRGLAADAGEFLTRLLLEAAPMLRGEIEKWDAQVSAENGITLGALIGRQLAKAGMDASRTMLVGHSNGAGLMGALAKAAFDETEVRIRELVALDAPWATSSLKEAASAAPAVGRLLNIFGTLTDFDITDVEPLEPLSLSLLPEWNELAGMGAPMWYGENITNVRLHAARSQDLIEDVFDDAGGDGRIHPVMHSYVPLRYALTADTTSFDDSWGFGGSVFGQGDIPALAGFYFNEGGLGVLDPLDQAIRIGEFSQAAFEWSKSVIDSMRGEVVSLWDGFTDNLSEAFQGLNVELLLPFRLAEARDLVMLIFQAQSPTTASLDLDIPAGVEYVTFDLLVIDPGNNDVLQVALGEHLLGEFSLSAVASLGGRQIELPIAGLGGSNLPLIFHMPSDRESSAQFAVSNLTLHISESWKQALPGTVPSASTDRYGKMTVTARNGAGRAVVFEEAADGNWLLKDLGTRAGGSPATNDPIVWTDPNDGLIYVAAPSAEGFVLYRRSRENVWTSQDLAAETGSARDAPVGTLSYFTTRPRTGTARVVVAGINANGEIVAYLQTSAATEGQAARWEFYNISDDLASQGMATPAFNRMTSYVTSWDQWTLAGLDGDGNVQGVWVHPASFTTWRVDNLSAITGADPLSGELDVTLTEWGGIRFAGADSRGRLIATWWNPALGPGDWRQTDLTGAVPGGSVPVLTGGRLTAWFAPGNLISYAGYDESGDIVSFYWQPSDGGRWNANNITGSLPNRSSRPTGAITSHVSPSGTMSILGVSSGQDVVRLWRASPTDAYRLDNLSQLLYEI